MAGFTQPAESRSLSQGKELASSWKSTMSSSNTDKECLSSAYLSSLGCQLKTSTTAIYPCCRYVTLSRFKYWQTKMRLRRRSKCVGLQSVALVCSPERSCRGWSKTTAASGEWVSCYVLSSGETQSAKQINILLWLLIGFLTAVVNILLQLLFIQHFGLLLCGIRLPGLITSSSCFLV